MVVAGGPAAPGVGEADESIAGRWGDEAVLRDWVATVRGGDPYGGWLDEFVNVDEFGFGGFVG